MKKYILIGIILALTSTGGCIQGNQSKNGGRVPSQLLPKTAAFQDKFTRSYMASQKEAEPGHYLLKSKTNGYTMLFPEDANILSDFGYEIHGQSYESFYYSPKDSGMDFNINIVYEDKPITNEIKVNLKMLSDSLKYNGKYNEIDENNKMIYFAKDVSIKKNYNYYNYFGFVKGKKNNKAISFVLMNQCSKTNNTCKLHDEEMDKLSIKYMKSITFFH